MLSMQLNSFVKKLGMVFGIAMLGASAPAMAHPNGGYANSQVIYVTVPAADYYGHNNHGQSHRYSDSQKWMKHSNRHAQGKMQPVIIKVVPVPAKKHHRLSPEERLERVIERQVHQIVHEAFRR